MKDEIKIEKTPSFDDLKNEISKRIDSIEDRLIASIDKVSIDAAKDRDELVRNIKDIFESAAKAMAAE